MNPLQSTYRDEFQLAVVVLLSAWAWYRGGGPERACAATMLAMFVSSRIYRAFFGALGDLWTADTWYFSLDVVVMVALLAIAMRANRFYPLLLAAFQLVAVCAHLVRSLVETISPIAYYIMYVGPSYFQLIIIGVGLWSHQRRIERHGSYRDWRRPAAAT